MLIKILIHIKYKYMYEIYSHDIIIYKIYFLFYQSRFFIYLSLSLLFRDIIKD